MKQDFFESSAFYSKRYKNFSTLLVIPIFLVVCFCIVISIFCKKEIVIQGSGNIQPISKIAVIQSQLDFPISKNNLQEGKKVKKGDTLLIYRNKNQDRENYFVQQIDAVKQQLSSLATLKLGVKNNIDTFNFNDEFGYHEELNAYLKQRDIYSNENNILKIQNSDSEKNKIAGYTTATNDDKLFILQSEKISDICKEEKKLRQSLSELEVNLKDYSNNTKITAPTSGILHVNQEHDGMRKVNVGTPLAEIYPDLQKEKKVKLVAYISERDITSIRKGQFLKLKFSTSNVTPLKLKGKITSISMTSTKINNRVFYIVSATAKVPSNMLSKVKYDMEGNTTVSIGNMSFFDYYKNKLLNKNIY